MRLDDVRTAELCKLRLAEQFLHRRQSERLALIEQRLIDARSLQIRKGLIHIVELANAATFYGLPAGDRLALQHSPQCVLLNGLQPLDERLCTDEDITDLGIAQEVRL